MNPRCPHYPLWPSKNCAIIGCETKNNDKTILLHRFPEDQTIFDIWVIRSGNIKLLNKPIDIIYKSSVICDKHFEESCKSPGFQKLIYNSAPSLNLPGKAYILILCLFLL